MVEERKILSTHNELPARANGRPQIDLTDDEPIIALEGTIKGRRFDAFISYSHSADSELASALQLGLEKLAKPWTSRRALSIFKDDSVMGVNPGVWGAITNHLDRSSWLIVLASQEAKKSKWVNKEVDYWLSTKGPRAKNRILLILTDGDIVWDDEADRYDDNASTALPRHLIDNVVDDPPLYLDLKWYRELPEADLRDYLNLENLRFRDAVAQVSSTIRGIPKDDLDGEAVRQERRTKRIRNGVLAVLATLAVVATTFGLQSNANAERANTEATNALTQASIAQAEEQRANQEAERANTEATNALTQASIAQAEEQRANQEAERANARAMAAQAELVMTRRPAVALTFAANAVATDPTTTANSALIGGRVALATEPWIADRSVINLVPDDGDVEAWGVSPRGGSVLAVIRRGDSLTLRSVSTSDRGMRVDQNLGAVRGDVAVSSLAIGEGPTVVVLRSDGTIYVSRAESSRIEELSAADVELQTVTNVELSPDGRHVVLIGEDGRGATSAVVMTTSAPQKIIDRRKANTARFSPSGNRVLLAESDMASLLDLETGAVQGLPGVDDALFQHGETTIAARAGDSIMIWSSAGEFKGSISPTDVGSWVLSPDGGAIAVAPKVFSRSVGSPYIDPNAQIEVEMWSTTTLALVERIGPFGSAFAFNHPTFSGDGKTLLVASRNLLTESEMRVRTFDRPTRLQLGTTIDKSMTNISVASLDFAERGSPQLRLSAAGEMLATEDVDGGIQIWSQNLGLGVRAIDTSFADHVGNGTRVAVGPGGDRFAIVSDPAIAFLSTMDGRVTNVVETPTTAAASRVEKVTWSPDGSYLAVSYAAHPETTVIASAANSQAVEVERFGEPVFLAGTEHVAGVQTDQFGGRTNRLRIIDRRTGTQVDTLDGHSSPVGSLFLDEAGSLYSFGQSLTDARVWNMAALSSQALLTAAEIRTVHDLIGSEPTSLAAVTMNPRATKVVMRYREAGEDKVLVLDAIDPAESAVFALPPPPSSYAPQGTFLMASADGKVIVGGTIGEPRIWDATTGRILHRSVPGLERAIAWVPGTATFLGTGSNGLGIWDARTGDPVGDTLVVTSATSVSSADFGATGGDLVYVGHQSLPGKLLVGDGGAASVGALIPDLFDTRIACRLAEPYIDALLTAALSPGSTAPSSCAS